MRMNRTFGMKVRLVRSISSRYNEVTGHAILRVSSPDYDSHEDWLFLDSTGRDLKFPSEGSCKDLPLLPLIVSWFWYIDVVALDTFER